MKKVILCVIFIALVSASCYVAPPGERETSVSHPPAISEPKSTVPSIVATGEPGEAGAELLIDTEAKELYPKVSPTNPDVIAYISCGTKGLKHYDIWMRNLLEKSSVKITESKASDILPAWTSDGKMLVFDSDRLPGTRTLWSVNIPGGDISPRLLLTERLFAFSPNVSYKGIIAFVSPERQGIIPSHIDCQDGPEFFDESNYIWTMAWDGRIRRRLHEGKDPSWSPDGTRLAFASDISGNYDLWLMDWDGSNLTQLTSSPDNEFEPTWSPDGRWIAFTSDQAGNRDIWIISSAGGQKIELTTSTAYEGGASWAENGYIYYHSNCRGGNWDIWRIKPNIELGKTIKPGKTTGKASDDKAYNAKIGVFNGTRIRGLAARTAQFLTDKGFNVVKVGNARTRRAQQTIIYYAAGYKNVAYYLAKKIIPGNQYIRPGKLPAGVDIQIVLGRNMRSFK